MKDIETKISHSLEEARNELESFIEAPETVRVIKAAAAVMAECLRDGGKIISCGNGGSLCDATHFAEELTGRFRNDRRPLPAMAVNDPAYLTCTGNDYSFEDVFSRWVEAFGKGGDMLLAISTSGTSANVVKAAKAARQAGMKVVALTSKKGQTLSALSDVAIMAPDAPHSDRIQEIHIKVIHILIEAIEALLEV
ncbi:MAG: SIS domain-containing protein [Bacteroidales bacterium]|nr:SIS domain-containing protein [Bacteroidales bacterium]